VAGFSDLVMAATPSLAAVEWAVTEGRDFLWVSDVVKDGAGDPIDLSGTTGVCKIVTDVGGSDVATLTYTGNADGTFQVEASAATMADTATGGTRTQPRVCFWSLVVTETSSGKKCQFWGPGNSPFEIAQEG
jgi:hypothetical protein